MTAEVKLLVHLDVPSGKLSWRAQGIKGAKWHSGCRDIDQVVKDWDKAGLPEKVEMVYVDHK